MCAHVRVHVLEKYHYGVYKYTECNCDKIIF